MTTKPKARKFRIRRSGETTPPKLAEPTQAERAPEQPAAARPAEAAQQPQQQPQQQQARSGDAASSQETQAETDIDAIRREGLTGRQLRMARRMAQKHGLAPISDFDAVRQLRQRGIDPFQNANMLELVVLKGKGAGATPQQPAQDAAAQKKIQLPQTMKAETAKVPSTDVYTADRRTAEISEIQRDIARRRRRRSILLLARLTAFVFLPTVLAGWYYYTIATPMYATKSEFLIQTAEGGGGGPLQGLIPTQLANNQESIGVQSYLTSKDAMIKLDSEEGYKLHFSHENIDPITRLDDTSSNEDMHKIYKRNIKIGYDPTEGLIKMEVIAADPQTAVKFSDALIRYAEERVESLSKNIRDDAMRDARKSLDDARAERRQAQENLIRLQELYGADPTEQLTALRGQISTYEQQLLEKQLALQALLDNARPNRAKVDGARGDVRRLEAVLTDLNARMTQPDNSGLSLVQQSTEIELARADLATSDAFLQSALQGEKQAAIEAGRQVRYLTVPVRPIASDAPSYPRKFENTALAFLIFSGVYLIVSLTASVLREQVSN